MENIAISVIVPSYNSFQTLERCINSIVSQTFQNFEVLLIDDGSNDGSEGLCDEYAQKYPQIKVLHKPNGGVSSARQLGIESAVGKYVIHIDADDWVEPSMLQDLYDTASENHADIVFCDYIEEKRGKKIYNKQDITNLDNDVILKKLLTGQLHGSCWNKLVRTELFRTYHIKFPANVNIYEDLYVSCLLLEQNVRVGYLNEAFYHYISDSANSMTKRISLKGIEEKLEFIRLMSSHRFTSMDDELYLYKKNTLYDIMLLNKWDLLTHTFPDIHRRIINERIKYNVFSPLGHLLILALQKKYFAFYSKLFFSKTALSIKSWLYSFS